MTADNLPRPGNLPAEPNSFVGRDRDLCELRQLLADVRTVTLCGPGGIGKTRLAIRLGAQADGFPDGVWLVELAATRDPALACSQVATTLGVREEPGRPAAATLADALRARRLLLILDNCEHLVCAVARLAGLLTAACPGLRIVATSREPLRVRGETVWRVQPLTLPCPVASPPALTALSAPQPELAARHEAVRLFADRARAARPGFALTDDNCAHVARICRVLDGVPLAIELAAARTGALSVEQIATRLGDRFRLLACGERTAPARQQTLRAAVDWSFELLTGDEQRMLARLSVFCGWSLEMAEQVCADDRIPAGRVLDLLALLVDKSLVTLEDELDGRARYRLLETIRDYAAARLAASGEEKAVRGRHLDLMVALGEDIHQVGLAGADSHREQLRRYERLSAEQGNFRDALTFCLGISDAHRGLRLCSALRSPWIVRGDSAEGQSWFGRFLALDEAVPAGVRARALTLAAELAFEHQDYCAAACHARAAVAICAAYPKASPAGGLRIQALISLRAGLAADALAQADAAIDAAASLADEWELGLGYIARAAVLASTGQLAAAEAAYAATDQLSTANMWGVAHARYGLGSLARSRRDDAAARQHFRDALEMFTELGSGPEIGRCLAGLGRVALAEHDLPAAAESLAQSLRLSIVSGQRLAIARGVEAIAALAVAGGDDAAAVRLDGTATALRQEVTPERSGATKAWLDALLGPARRRLGPRRAARLAAEGRLLGLGEGPGYALRTACAAAGPAAGDRDGTDRDGTDRDGTGGAPALTPREREIAQLIARGLTNRGIAEELVISPATAARHVANILAKLGLSSRAQVAARVAAGASGRGAAADGASTYPATQF